MVSSIYSTWSRRSHSPLWLPPAMSVIQTVCRYCWSIIFQLGIIIQTSLSSRFKISQWPFLDDDGIPVPEITSLDYVNLTTHADTFGVDPVPISWGHPDPEVRGPVICTVRHHSQRNAIGAHSGSYCVYTGLAVAAGKLNPDYLPNLKLTSPVFKIGPHGEFVIITRKNICCRLQIWIHIN